MEATSQPLFRHRLEIAIHQKQLSRVEVAKRAGISVQSVGNYINGTRKPDCEIIAKLSKVLDVSSDWLIGLTDVSTPDITIQEIHRALGISETAISNLRELNTQNRQDCLNFISAMLSSSYFDSVQKTV